MTDDREVRRRPGGRSARVTAAVHTAVDELLVEEGPGGFTVADVARRAGVNPSSIHRRWGSLEAVILELEAAKLTEISPLPDTGTLRGDLLAYARTAAADIVRPGRLAFLQALIGARDLNTEQRSAPLLQRAAQLQSMLDRARDRGEPSLHYTAIVDCILAPVYLRYLLGMSIDEPDLELFLDRTLASTALPNTR
ncbi:TetR/AcrR family transcriptional regulator [Mycolicibacterium komossense]|uniref:TetR/AcrR family transcriptional regulator n=1 Tax=Mycolicibacterium komossense TaxID=1779 RepID=A0ABT3CFA0_9MYCO|nr:TetR/AcrR family transcriptional regulator [Mycolicibacterium komossense]MCV7228086.1 TetR/AcrR family transcriptional regulator [Mycolicibacterium komossense]